MWFHDEYLLQPFLCFNAFSHSQVNHYCELQPDSELAKIKVQSWLAKVAWAFDFAECNKLMNFVLDCLILLRSYLPIFWLAISPAERLPCLADLHVYRWDIQPTKLARVWDAVETTMNCILFFCLEQRLIDFTLRVVTRWFAIHVPLKRPCSGDDL